MGKRRKKQLTERSAPRSARPTFPLVPPRSDADGTWLRLLEAAVALFAQRGYHGVPVRDITAAVGIMPSALYAHAPSKEHLLAELARVGHEETRDALRDALLCAGSDPRSQLHEYVSTYVKVVATYPLLTLVVNNELHALSPEHLRDALAARVEMGALLKAIIERGVSEGVFDCPDPSLAVLAIAGMGLRIATWYRHPGHERIEAGDSYPGLLQDEFLSSDYSVHDLQTAFAGYALRLCGARTDE
jgi:AcrR family transcriptional regulator